MLRLPLWGNSFENPIETNTYSPNFRYVNRNDINVVFTHHNDIFSKNERRNYPYGITLSKIQSKQVLIHLFSDT